MRLTSITPSPVMPRSRRRSLVGASQSQTWMGPDATSLPGCGDVTCQMPVPPDMINVDCRTNTAFLIGIQLFANRKRFPQAGDAGSITGVHGMERLDRERHSRLSRVRQKRAEPVRHLCSSSVEILAALGKASNH